MARNYLNRALEEGGDLTPFSNLNRSYLYLAEGKKNEAYNILDRIQESLQGSIKNIDLGRDFSKYLDMSIIHILKDEKEESLQYLAKAADVGFTMGLA